jgi:hypothetical protein
MPRLFSRILKTANPHSTTTTPTHRYEGFTEEGRVVLSDRRGTKKAEIPEVNLKSETLGCDNRDRCRCACHR